VVAAGLLAAVTGRAAGPLAPLLDCRTLADATARLACFDRESAKLSQDPAAAGQSPSAPQTADRIPAASAPRSAADTSDRTPAASAPRPAVDALQSFGLPEGKIAAQEVAAGARPAELSRIDAHVSSVLLAVSGQATFKLDNGQVWREISAEGDLLAKPGDAVEISRGVFHSYWLQLKSGRGCKVRRVL
jgi:hypothetical protein